MYQGSCLCARIHVEINGPITSIIHCHCSLCRKNSGTAYATNGFVECANFNIVKGRENLTTFEFKPGKQRHFCTSCGSPIFSSNSENPHKIRIRLGLLDSDIVERPQSHNFIGSKANWDELHVDLPCYEGFEPSRQ